ncbi:MAG TPA: hypothetical protein VKD91_11165 [Pyrinomonadaceae bacterium]|nr:hypothetical protein [Pyrinomonadaceae bacterium]
MPDQESKRQKIVASITAISFIDFIPDNEAKIDHQRHAFFGGQVDLSPEIV